jgi:tetratricopeptide (TPR) repeat protein
VLTFGGHVDKAAEPLERALRGASAIGRKDLLCEALINRGIHCALTGRVDEGIVLFEGAIKVAERNGFTRLRVRAELNAADQCLRAGLPDAEERTLIALEQSRRLGDRGQEAVAAGNVMLAWLLAGRWDEIEQLAEGQLAGARAALRDSEFVLNRLAVLYAMRGDVAAARKAQDETEAWASTLAFESRMLRQASEGAVSMAEGRPAVALELLSEMMREDLRVEGPSGEGLRMAFPDAVDAAVQCGKLDEGASLIDTLEAEPPGYVGPYMRAQLVRGRALIGAARGESDAVEEKLLDAIDRFRALGYPYWLARAQTDLASWLIDAGRGTDAAPLLDEAIKVFESLRAAPALARALELSSTEPAAHALGA